MVSAHCSRIPARPPPDPCTPLQPELRKATAGSLHATIATAHPYPAPRIWLDEPPLHALHHGHLHRQPQHQPLRLTPTFYVDLQNLGGHGVACLVLKYFPTTAICTCSKGYLADMIDSLHPCRIRHLVRTHLVTMHQLFDLILKAV
jgi:hypothetical protein